MKKIISVILALTMIFTFAACGGDTPGTDSSVPADTWISDGAEYWGTWVNDVKLIRIYENGSFELEYNGEIYGTGYYQSADGLTLELDDGGTMFFVLDEYGNLYGGEDNGTYTKQTDENVYVGIWINDDKIIRIYADGTFELDDINNGVYGKGNYLADDGLTLELDDGGTMFFVLDEYGNLYGGEDYGTYRKTENNENPTIPASTPERYMGFWKYPDGTILEMKEEEWNLYSRDGLTLYQYGPVEYEDGHAFLMKPNGGSGGGVLGFDGNGRLMDGEQELSWHGKFLFENTNLNFFIEGEWLYSEQENILWFDGESRFVWEFADHGEEGTYEFDGENLYLYYDDEGYTYAIMNEEGCIIVEGDAGSYYYRNDDF